MKRSDTSPHTAYAVKVSIITIIVNAVLAAVKFAAGILGHSGAMISDAVHTVSDVLSTFVVIIGVKLADKEADKEHPYGHERLECVAAILLSILLGAVGVGIGLSAVEKLTGAKEVTAVPSMLALWAAVLSVLVKEGMFWYTRAAAKKVNSGALMADAWHHRSDALSSVGAFVGMLFARLGFPMMDPLAEAIICLCILKAALDIFRDGLNKMVDRSCAPETERAICDIAKSVDGVKDIASLKTRLFGAKMYVDMEILVDGNLPLKDAHAIADTVHDTIEDTFEECKHCMIHLDPYIGDDHI